MTTLAYKDGVLAADSMALNSWNILGAKGKIDRRGDILFGASGRSSAICRKFVDWGRRGFVGDPPQMSYEADLDACGFIVPEADRIIMWTKDGPNEFRAPFFAFGSGGEFATGALAAGASPQEAIRIAARFDLGTNLPLRVVARPDVVLPKEAP